MEINIFKKEHGKIFWGDKEIRFPEKYKCLLPCVGIRVKNKYTLTLSILHLHTTYSLLDSIIDIKSLSGLLATQKIEDTCDGNVFVVAKYPQICAITDHGNISGAFEFSREMEKKGVIPITGVEIYMEGLDHEKKAFHLVLLVKDDTGYKNLCNILSEAEDNLHRKPLVTWDLLAKKSEGLVCLCACVGGEIQKKILAGEKEKALECVKRFKQIFGDDFYLEIQDHGLKEEAIVTAGLKEISESEKIPIVGTPDAHYLKKESHMAHDVHLCIGTKKNIDDVNRMRFGSGYHVPTNKELYKFGQQSVEAYAQIAKKCRFRMRKRDIIMPVFKDEREENKNLTETQLFEKACKKGFEERFAHVDIDRDVYQKRLNFEIDIIKKMKFESYFLIVSDFVCFAKEKGIAVGPGRGSAVGSLVSYCLKITNLDPIPYGLLFERFLNPERVSMPDIDLDFDERRQEVIDYVSDKYGKEKVSRILTFGTMAPRASIRDVGRVLNVPLKDIDKLAKAIPMEVGITLKKALNTSEVKALLEENSALGEVYKIATELEGQKRHWSVHACGVVISAKPTKDMFPEINMKDGDGNVSKTAAFVMTEIEELGSLKMDFLGLRNMSIIKKTSNDIGVKMDSSARFLEDVNVYKYLAKGDTDGLFQIESPGMKSLMKDIFSDLKSNTVVDGKELFERLVAAISLYRPGPMDYIPDYIEGMKNPETISYAVPQLKQILQSTYGQIVYQEQVQQIVQKLAGYSLARGDIIRRAMGKKKIAEMEREREIFLFGNEGEVKKDPGILPVDGCVKRGIPEKVAVDIWNKMARFAEYAFNKSHAAGYAVIAVQTAWLKYYYPTEFWTNTLNSVIGEKNKLKKYIYSTKKSGLKILAPDVNMSQALFAKDADNTIRMGLVLRNLSEKTAREIVDERNAHGTFKSLCDFFNRTNVDNGAFCALAYTGALDCFEGSRSSKIAGFSLLAKNREANKEQQQYVMMPGMEEYLEKNVFLPDLPELGKKDLLEREYEYAGMYITEHPLDRFKSVLKTFKKDNISDLIQEEEEQEQSAPEAGFSKAEEEKRVVIAGIIKDISRIVTKKGELMSTFDLEDVTGKVKVVVFPSDHKKFFSIIEEGNVVRVDGLYKKDSFGVSVLTSSLCELSSISVSPKKYVIKVDNNMVKLKEIIDFLYTASCEEDGNVLVELVDQKGRSCFLKNSNTTEVTACLTKNVNNALCIDPGFGVYAKVKKMARHVEVL